MVRVQHYRWIKVTLNIMCGCHYGVGVAAKAQELSRGTRFTRKGEDMRGAGCSIREGWSAKVLTTVFRIARRRQKSFRENTGFTAKTEGFYVQYMGPRWTIIGQSFRGQNVNLGMTIMTMGPGKLWVSVAPESRAGLNGIDSLLYTSRGRHIDLPRPNVAKSQSFIWRVLVMVSW